jgi:hypothetical protein
MRGLERIAADRRHLVAAQVRCSTGFTQGRVVDGRAVVAVPRRIALPAATMPVELPGRLLGWVAARSPAVFLPPEADLAELLGLDGAAAGYLATAWGVLAQRGQVRVRRGRAGAWPGQWMVWEAQGARLHRSAGAPMAWAADGADGGAA